MPLTFSAIDETSLSSSSFSRLGSIALRCLLRRDRAGERSFSTTFFCSTRPFERPADSCQAMMRSKKPSITSPRSTMLRIASLAQLP